ncbi:oxidoreductase short chain dehydrogenase/reductase [Aspergillus fumigatus]|nr:oxidoreductase short chain dehydrogenase/reductase [Aspergillus fumigatus]
MGIRDQRCRCGQCLSPEHQETNIGTGLSAATAEALASGDAAAIILMGKSQAEAQAMIDDINHKHPKAKLIFISVDFGRLASVCEAAEAIRKLEVPIDGFVGFPTVMAGPWMKTEDGIESHFQCNYLSNFLLINLVVHLMPAGSRVVIVCSSIRPEAPPPAWDDPNFADGKKYHPLDAYALSIFANVQMVKCLAITGCGRSMATFSVNTGNTKPSLQTVASPEQSARFQVGEDLPLLLQQAPKSASQGITTILRALLDPDISDNCQILALPKIDFPAGEENGRALWTQSEQLVGQEFKRL